MAVAETGKVEVVEPSTPWGINYGTDSCRLSRIFGTGKARTLFYIEKYGISGNFTELMAGEPLSRFGRLGAALRFSNGSGVEEPLAGQFEDFGPAFVSNSGNFFPKDLIITRILKPKSQPDPASPTDADDSSKIAHPSLSPEMLHDITWVEASRGRTSLRLATGPMDQPMAALEKCVDDLVSSWGVDPAQVRSARQDPRPLPETFKRVALTIQTSYPEAAIRARESATLSVRLVIDATGHVESCHILHITTATNFDNSACTEFQKHGRFTPAVGADGRPFKSIYTAAIVYRIQ